MKSNFTSFAPFAVVFFMLITTIHSQNLPANFVGGGEHKFNENQIPCITDAQRVAVKTEINTNISQLQLQNRLAFNELNRGVQLSFIWPIQKAAGVTYNDVWSISGYFDHNAAYPNQLTDYDCGTKTYDTDTGYNHLGVDVFTWPFSWKMMDNDEVEIIAGAAGQIIGKGGSQFDRSCNFNSNPWNAVYVQHYDGSVALYGHMKQNSLTTKNVGDMVTTGEFLGIVGSSGNSTGPHLHFEVYSEIEINGVGQDVVVDPYAGACNNLNVNTWWQLQKPYSNPNINAVLTHTAPPVFPSCPTTETTNESNQFALGDTAYFGLYMRDQEAGTSVNLKIIRPNNTNLYDWNFDFTANYYASYWYWSSAFDAEGQWKWQATYQGQTVTHTFNVGTLSIGDESFESTSIYPNPFKDIITVSSSSVIQKATVVDVLGKTIKVIDNSSEGIKEINLEFIANGLYFLILEGDTSQKKIIKMIKE